jgi:hypothetical protein
MGTERGDICCPHCWKVISAEEYDRHAMCVTCRSTPRQKRLCPGDSSVTVHECVVGNTCGCDERDAYPCSCQHINREPWLIGAEDCPLHNFDFRNHLKDSSHA